MARSAIRVALCGSATATRTRANMPAVSGRRLSGPLGFSNLARTLIELVAGSTRLSTKSTTPLNENLGSPPIAISTGITTLAALADEGSDSHRLVRKFRQHR